jgi:predicted phage terminase large subunit-like protein
MSKAIEIKRELEDLLNEVDYAYLHKDYVPSQFALEFITFIKLVNGSTGEENKSPVIHLDMLDQIVEHDENLFVSFRGSAKTTALHEYMYLYLATYGKIPKFGTVDVAMYISDTIDNGVKSMRQNLEFRWNRSEFLQKYVPYTRFTDVRWEFQNLEGKFFCVRGFGASTGVRGFKEYGKRPTWCGFDDLMSDKNAESATITKDIRNIIYKAARQAMHPKKRKINWTGTPFNKKDPLYDAAGSKSWNVRVYPICEKFPCTREEFRGAWEDRFNYDFVSNEYQKLLGNGEIAAFDQELMLRISSDENRMVQENDLVWYDSTTVLQNKSNYNFYITTDFATSEKTSADYSVISVWAYNNNGDWLWVDGTIKRQLMDQNIDDVFRFVSMYKPQSVGIEVTGQQGGFIQWIKDQMLVRNIFFNLASEGNNGNEGIRPNTNKMVRFNTVVPMFKQKKVWFPRDRKETAEMVEIMDEIRNATIGGFKSKHDDFIDTVSMLSVMNPWKPSEQSAIVKQDDKGVWVSDYVEEENNNSYDVY